MQRLLAFAIFCAGFSKRNSREQLGSNKMLIQVIQESSAHSALCPPFFGPRKLTLTFHRIFDHEAVDLDKVQTQRAEHFQFARTDGNCNNRCNST